MAALRSLEDERPYGEPMLCWTRRHQDLCVKCGVALEAGCLCDVDATDAGQGDGLVWMEVGDR